ncbi:hypothetical protein [Burkholderia cepacia]|uniref:hypothetical protein n=1 Tax=Burkholderia cepacia TaxID=292 RepID=UPI000F5ADA85|nr:hypothetical protein [Burkholderia cepacia]RQT65315.1 hypothetical protein DF029_28935 [Burkholderia cepacia]
MKVLIAFFVATLIPLSELSSAQTAAEFRSQITNQAIGSLCAQEMDLFGQFIGKRIAGVSRDQVLVQIDDYVTSKRQPAELAQLHLLMLNTAFSGAKLTLKDFQGDAPSPRGQALLAKAHMACMQYMGAINSDH